MSLNKNSTALDKLFDTDDPLHFSPENDSIFLEAMRESYTHHRNSSDFYRYIVDRRDRFDAAELRDMGDLQRIPWVFVNAFKLHEFLSVPTEDIEITLTSSGTTANTKSRNSWDKSSMKRLNIAVQMIGNSIGIRDTDTRPDYLIFGYDAEKAGDLGTAWSDRNIQQLAPANSVFYALKKRKITKKTLDNDGWHFDMEGCIKFLKKHARAGTRVRIIGFPAFLWETLLRCENVNTVLHPESVVILGGGWKNHTGREIPREEFFRRTGEALGLPRARMVDIYGLVEHGIPYMTCAAGQFHVPVYCRALCRDPHTLKVLKPGQPGLLQLLTPYLSSVPALSLLTSDKAIIHEKCTCGHNSPIIELCGRGGIKKHKGCAVKAAELLGDQNKDSTQGISGSSHTNAAEPYREPHSQKAFTHPLEKRICVMGRFIPSTGRLTPEKAGKIMDTAHLRKNEIASTSLEEVLDVLDRVSVRWANPSYRHRLDALALIPEKIGFSPEMVEKGIEAVAAMCSREALEKVINRELGNEGLYGGRELLSGFFWHPLRNHYLSARPAGVVLHVTAGNVFVGAIASLIPGLLSRSVNIMKLSSADPIFPLLFVKSITECGAAGRKVASSITMIRWKGGDRDIENILKRRSDRIMVFGGQETMESYRQGLPPGVTLLEHGPKFGIACIGLDSPESLDELARMGALDVLMWDQQACSSPHIFYVETGPDISDEQSSDNGAASNRPAEFAEKLAKALKDAAATLPPGQRSDDEWIERLKVIEEHQVHSFFGNGRCLDAGKGGLVLLGNTSEFEPSPGERIVHVRPVQSLQSLPKMLAPKGYYLQTAGISASEGRIVKLAEMFSNAGASRITRIGGMHQGIDGAPHDGGFPLRELLRFVDIEKSPPGRPAFDFLLPEKIAAITDSRLIEITDYARNNSVFWRRKLRNWQKKRCFQSLPLTSKEEVFGQTPPDSTAMLTRNTTEGSYIFGSGGTTSAVNSGSGRNSTGPGHDRGGSRADTNGPRHKIFLFTPEELEKSTLVFGDGFIASGMKSSDVIANLFMPGNLWTSFLVVNKALERVGCTILPIGGNAAPAMALGAMKDFGCTVICGIPTYMASLARHALQNNLNIKLRAVAYAGEHMHSRTRHIIQKAFNPERIMSLGYAAVDAGPIGYQCEYCEGTVHHVASEYCHLEILDSEGNGVSEGQIGEVVITNLHKRLQPVIRYRVGDRARRLSGHCRCGRNSMLFELLDRADDVFVFSGSNVPLSLIDKSISDVPGAGSVYRVDIQNDQEGRDILILNVELSPEPGPRNPDFSSDMIQSLLNNSVDMAEDYKADVIRIEIRPLPAGTLKPLNRTGKMKKINDLR